MKWFTSDLHIDHENVLIGPRGKHFPTLKLWQDGIMDAINSCLGKQDMLFILGDFAFGDLQKWRSKIKRGTVWLIKGNHDPSDLQCTAAFGKNFRHTYMTKIGSSPCWLSHYAHAFWPSSHRGSHHLYGHTHNQREDTLNTWMPDRRSTDVCPETVFEITGQFRPINEYELLEFFKDRPGHDHVDFYLNRQGKYEPKSAN
jgi:calcineurin-like phosphoesterase family protein